MTLVSPDSGPGAPPASRPGAGAASDLLGSRQRFARRFFAKRAVIPASLIVLAVLVAGIFAPWLAPYDPLDQSLLDTMQGPSWEHWLGTDDLGRDVLSRLIFGARIVLIAVAQAMTVAVVIGVPIGLFIGYMGGWWDRIVMRVVEAVISVPGIMVVIVIITVLGTGLTKAMIALGLLFSTAFLRLARGLVIAEREELYVRAARVVGAGTGRIVRKQILPNIAAPLIVQITLTTAAVLLAEAGLSFLGLAVQPPDASWGTMLTTASRFINLHPWLALPPGIAIALVVLAVNLLGDAIRDSIGRGVGETVTLRPAARDPSAAGTGAGDASAGQRVRAGVRADGVPPDAVLAISSLHVLFPSPRGVPLTVVSDVSLHVRAGETLGLVGESGCGKSVTAMAVLGLVPEPGAATAEAILVGGHDVAAMSRRDLQRIRGTQAAAIFQDPTTSLNPAFRIGDQLSEILRIKRGMTRKASRRRAVELLEMVGIPDAAARARAFPHELSGGMAQRVAIARALSCEPKLLIADEPTTALDVTVQAEVLALLRDLQRELGMGMLFITHDLAVVADICDRAAVMYAGEIVEEAEVTELFANPRHPYTEGLLGAVPQAAHRGTALRAIPGVVPQPGEWPTGCRFAPRCPYSTTQCTAAPVEIEVQHAHQARCVRAAELTLDGAE